MKFPVQAVYDWYRTAIRNPKYRWWVILGSLAYFFSPIDIAPDFIPVLGQLDDMVVLTLLVSEVSQMLFDRAKSGKSSTEATQAKSVDVEAINLN